MTRYLATWRMQFEILANALPSQLEFGWHAPNDVAQALTT